MSSFFELWSITIISNFIFGKLIFALLIDLIIEFKDLNVYSSLDLTDSIIENGESVYFFESNKIKQVIFLVGKSDLNIKEFKIDENLINININSKDFELESEKASMKKIFEFIKSIDGINQPSKILITNEKYSKRPFYGLSIMPTFLNSFSRSFEFEIKMLSIYLQFLINTANLQRGAVESNSNAPL